ncbi:hypothetical protein BH10PSE10_BH10PSE10_27730 [soil metagenome]
MTAFVARAVTLRSRSEAETSKGDGLLRLVILRC